MRSLSPYQGDVNTVFQDDVIFPRFNIAHNAHCDLRTTAAAGVLLAFALSFNEVIATTFTAGAQNALRLWIFGAIRLGQNLPEVNAVVAGVVVLTLLPIAYAAKISSSAQTGAVLD